MVASIAGMGLALDNGLAMVPQMGYNFWNKFQCNITEDMAKGTADLFIELGLDKLGYEYLNLDDCWMETDRTADGHFIPTEYFPSGMKALGDYIHDKGLKFGIYSSAGTLTCAGRAGSLNYEEIDAQDWASWGVDYLKYDNCNDQGVPGTIRYIKMRDALAATGRDIFFSMCNWGAEDSWRWARDIGNSWRTTADIMNNFDSMKDNFLRSQESFFRSGPGGWLDPDMLQIGNGGLTHDEEKTHFALWALAKAPLLIGCDLNNVSQDSLDILKNADLIAVNQDPKSAMAVCYEGCDSTDGLQAYVTQLGDKSKVAVLVNWGDEAIDSYKMSIEYLGVEPSSTQFVQIYDMWTHEVVGTFTTEDISNYTFTNIPAHGNLTYKFSLVEQSDLFLKQFSQ